ncbi:MAG: hypothetical protein U0M15_08775 [Bacillota bacterium]|nr:hypothetical protein [Bacillota bacterium]
MKIILCNVRQKIWKGLISFAILLGLLWGVPHFYGVLAEKNEKPYEELTEPLRVMLPGDGGLLYQPDKILENP